MSTISKSFQIDPHNFERAMLNEAAKILLSGGLVVFPTETVYGLGALARDATAAKRIYAAKGRPSDNPLIVHVDSIRMAQTAVADMTDEARVLAEKFWPGPLTIILKKSENIPTETTGGLDTVAIRMPDNNIALSLIEICGEPIAAPSANLSGRPSPTRISHVYEDLDGRVDAIIDGGDVELGLESTIVDLTVTPPAVLRAGFIGADEIQRALKIEVRSRDIRCETTDAPKAPGMKYRHYAPKARLFIVSGEDESAAKKTADLAHEARDKGLKSAIISSCEFAKYYDDKDLLYVIGSRNDSKEIAGNLYDILHKLDEDNVEIAYCESFYNIDLCEAIMERLIKAAGHRILE